MDPIPLQKDTGEEGEGLLLETHVHSPPWDIASTSVGHNQELCHAGETRAEGLKISEAVLLLRLMMQLVGCCG
jgi:hypothetical protein